MIVIDRTSITILRDLAARGAPAWLCVDPMEYHGPHLSPRNDQIIAEGLMERAHALLQERHPEWPLVFAGQLGIGADTTPGPGSVDVPYREVLRRTREAGRRLLDLGFRRMVFMTFHGSPFHNAAIWAAAEDLRGRGARVATPMNVLTRKIMAPDPEEFEAVYEAVPDPSDRARLRARAREDIHSGFGETSLALHFAPDTVVDHLSVPPAPALGSIAVWEAAARVADTFGRRELAKELRFVGMGMAWFGLRPFPGYTCEPAMANAEVGAIFAGLISAGLASDVESVLVEGVRPSPPVMRWVATLTFGGIYGRAHVPLRVCAHQVHPQESSHVEQ
ncbi:MAG: creatininase family protein [Pseudomonadota bacterium]